MSNSNSPLTNYPSDNLSLLNPKQSTNPNLRRTLSSIDTPGASRNSSLQKVWAEDYYNIDYPSEGEYTDQGVKESGEEAQPCTTLEREQEVSATSSQEYQRPLTDLLPFRTQTNSRSPERKTQLDPKQELEESRPTFTGDKEGVIKVADKSKGIASWFTGSSAPVSVGISVAEELPPTMSSTRESSPERAKLKKRPTLPAIESSSITPKNASAASRVASFFSSPRTPSKLAAVQLPADLNNDDFLTLNITSSLFPAGVSSEQDPFSPAAFKNLLQNAEGLLSKLQNAYKLRTLSLHELSAEMEEMADQLVEAETKNTLLKSNLADMAQQAAEKDSTIAELMTELTKERQARMNEKEAREKSIVLVKSRPEYDMAKRGSTSDLSIDTTAEDLDISSTRQNRQSRDTYFSTEPESDAESGAGESVFSRARSPVSSVAGTVDSTPEVMQGAFGRVVSNSSYTSGMEKRPKIVQQRSTFQKILEKVTPSSEKEIVEKDLYGGIGMGEEGCGNCRGRDASVAWDTVGLMRAENKELKDQVSALESGVDGALDLLYGYGLPRA